MRVSGCRCGRLDAYVAHQTLSFSYCDLLLVLPIAAKYLSLSTKFMLSSPMAEHEPLPPLHSFLNGWKEPPTLLICHLACSTAWLHC